MTIYLPQPRGTDPVVYRWMQAVTKALDSTDTVAPIDPSGFLPTTTTVQGIGALGFSGTLAEGTVLITLKPLDDSGLGTLLKITRDIYGRVSGTQEATAADLPYDPTTSGLSATDVQAAIDSIVAGVAITVSDTAPAFPVNGQGWVDTTDGTFYIWYDDGTSAAWVAFGTAGGGGTAATTTYDHSTSGLAATDVQAAIDEVAANAGGPTPTGTGFRHVAAGVEDAAAKLVDTADINSAAITYGKLQNVSASSRLLGSSATGAGAAPSEISLGTNISMTGSTLNVASGVTSYAQGTTNPPTPVSGDKFYRTDLNLLIYYDGVRWLTVQEYTLGYTFTGAAFPIAVSSGAVLRAPVPSDFDSYLTRFIFVTELTGGNNASNYWSFALASGSTPTTITTVTTASDAASSITSHEVSVNAVVTKTDKRLFVLPTKVGSPASVYPYISILYRKVIT